MRDQRPFLLVAVLLALLTIGAFRNVARNGFIGYDDTGYLTKNPMVRQGLSLPGVAWAFTTTHQANWHPLTWLSHMLDFSLFGVNPGAHHLVSLALHLANALLLLTALRRLTGELWPSALVAALFAVHPLHVESVAWAAERKDVLSTLFALAALLAYVRAARRGAVARSAAAPLLFTLALLAKPMPISLPFLLLLLDWWPLGRWAPGISLQSHRPGSRPLPPARLWIEKLPLFIVAGASAAVTLYAQSHAGAKVSQLALPLRARAANALLSYTGYLARALWPVDLSIYYPHPVRLPPWHLLAGSVAILAALSLVAALGARRSPWVAVGWLWYLGSLVPVIGLVQVGSQGMADRYTYLPLTGVFVAVAWSIAFVAERRPNLRAPFSIACVAALLTLAALTSRQVALWRNTRTLFSHALSLSGDNAMAHNSLGIWLSSEGRFQEALDHFSGAVRLNPWSAEYFFNCGTALEALGNIPAAESSYRRALDLDQSHALAWNNLGNVFNKQGRSTEAAISFQRALLIDPRLPQAHFNLGAVLASQGRIDEAVAHFTTALEIDPGSYHVHTNLGVILAGEGKFKEAVAHFRAAIERDPQNAAAHRNLGNALLALGDREGAAAELRKVREQETDPAPAQNPAPAAGDAGAR